MKNREEKNETIKIKVFLLKPGRQLEFADLQFRKENSSISMSSA